MTKNRDILLMNSTIMTIIDQIFTNKYPFIKNSAINIKEYPKKKYNYFKIFISLNFIFNFLF